MQRKKTLFERARDLADWLDIVARICGPMVRLVGMAAAAWAAAGYLG